MGFVKRLKLYPVFIVLIVVTSAYGGEAPIRGKVVSLAPSVTETLFAMGLGHRIAGTTDHSDYPPEAAEIPRVGKFLSPELERILALHPAACIGLAGSTSPRLVKLLNKFGIPTLLVDVSRLEGLLHSIGEMGTFLGENKLGDQLQKAYVERLNSIKEQTSGLARPRVLSVISVSPIYSAGPNTFISDIIRCAGGEPIGLGNGKAWQGLSWEAVLWLKPDVIVFAAHAGVVPEWMRKSPLDGVRIISIDPALIIRPTPRLIDSAEMLAGSLHN